MSENIELVKAALQALEAKPASLERAIQGIADLREVTFAAPLDWLAGHVRGREVSDDLNHRLGIALRQWDREKDGGWTQGTTVWTEARRRIIYSRLAIPPALQALFSERFPIFSESEQPLVVSEKHVPWYSTERKQKRFYWSAYSKYLVERRMWSSDAVAQLDASTDAVVERLSDPVREAAFQAKGLVVGYVQSGKTAHFSGVLAKAADAGYRLIIVLAGTIDILRQQTQRRVDKELIGKELVTPDYKNDQDWSEFLTHGELPSALGAFDWQRLTGTDEDYRSLHRGIEALEFKGVNQALPFNSLENLRGAPARIIVLKKNPRVLRRLAKDLARLRTRLNQVPALIVDDESDQASLNTVKPDKATQKKRTSTNEEITSLLRTLPRGQYLGYTATPFANVLVNPDDAEDLFPKDFIVSLPRPAGYMGVLDFFDLGAPKAGFKSNERAFVRPVIGSDDADDNLQKALDSFVLSGALKLYRAEKLKSTVPFKHHTMLVHHAAYKIVHADQAEEIARRFEGGGYFGKVGMERLAKLFAEDFHPVSLAQAPGEPIPDKFGLLSPYIGRCVQLVSQDTPVRIMNGDNKDHTPNFDQAPVWSILVGGAKLSRGYTVEGLTTTYFRRVATASDTLMQMGRWFGFRPGYRDLVRLFIGRDEPLGKKKRLDLYEAFQAICLDEEEFRSDIRKYVEIQGLRPLQIPPLIPSHLEVMKPTARNKMYNATVASRNYGGALVERTVATQKPKEMEHNERLAIDLLKSASPATRTLRFLGAAGESVEVSAITTEVAPKAVLAFLEQYIWKDDAKVLQRELEFMRGSHQGDPGIDRWFILAPQKRGEGLWPRKGRDLPVSFTVKERSIVGQRFGVYSEPDHVTLAKLLARVDAEGAGLDEASRALARERQAVLLFYPVVPRGEPNSKVTMGFAIQFPGNKLPKTLYYKVRKKADAAGNTPAVIKKV